MKQSLKDRLTNYLRKNPVWTANGSLQRLVAAKTTYTPRTTCRRLEELVNEGILEVKYVKGHSWYKAKTDAPKTTETLIKEGLVWFENLQTPQERQTHQTQR